MEALALPQQSKVEYNRLVELLDTFNKYGSPVDWGTLVAAWDAFRNQNGVGLDDRLFLLEKILVFMSRMPPSASQFATQVEHFMIDFLYKDLPHPPSTFLGSAGNMAPLATDDLGLLGFAYREADGSRNNCIMPELGAAHRPYARSVAAAHVAPPSTLPDPGLVFDMLLKRKENVNHPTGLSSMFFAFANLIIHSLFRTNRENKSINDTSSYLDLSPLYGVDADEQQKVRKFDGTGQLHEDTFADRRLLAMPPATPALLVIFNRNHNFVAKRILEIDEQGKYSKDLFPDDEQSRKKQDDEIFNRARLVNCGAFMQVIMRDYVGCILHMIPDGNPWHLRPLDEIRDKSHEIAPRGEGNVCSVEFNLLYRWHATTSTRDAKWLDEVFQKQGASNHDELTEKDFYIAAGKAIAMQSRDANKPQTWTFGGLNRDPTTGRFDDGALADVLQSATADTAQAFRARGIPAAFKVIEILGIKEARSWGVCSLNEFRKFLGLKPYKSFKEWNPDPEIHTVAERLYHDIENLELYVGMQAEEARPSIPGSGLASGYTMSRSILADAVALIRGDRFLTIEYTPYNLTSWGFQDCETTDDNGSLGGMLTKLLFRALPNHYRPNSIYAHFPFVVPEKMKDFLIRQKIGIASVSQYNWSDPRSQFVQPIIRINDVTAITTIVTDTAHFVTPYESFVSILTENHGFYHGATDTPKNQRNKALIDRVLFSREKIAAYGSFYYEKTLELLAEKSFMAVGSASRTVDIVREVINCLPLHWIVNYVVDLPLKTVDTVNKLKDGYTEQELFGYLAVIFSYIYLNVEPANSWFLQQHSKEATKKLIKDISSKVHERPRADVLKIFHTVGSFLHGRNDKHRLTALHELIKETHDAHDDNEVIYNVLGIIVNSASNWSRAMTHVINFYLDSPDKDVITGLSRGPWNNDTENLLVGYVREALRLDPPVAGVLRVARTSPVNLRSQTVGQNDRVYVDLKRALQSESIPNAKEVQPQRSRVPNLSFVPGAHSSLNEDFTEKTMAQVLRAVFSKKNLRRGHGASGKLATFIDNYHGTEQRRFVDAKGAITAWPQSLVLQYDA